MASETTNYKLVKPDPEEFYDVGVQNSNLDKIDTALKELEDNKIESVNGKTGKNVQITSGDITVLNTTVTEETPPSEYPLGISVKYNYMPENTFNGINVGYGIIETLRPATNNRAIQFLHCFRANGQYVDTYKRTSNDNAWQSWRKEVASTDITDSTTIDDSTKVASAKAVKTVNDNLTSLQQTINKHLADTSNPHNTTTAQINRLGLNAFNESTPISEYPLGYTIFYAQMASNSFLGKTSGFAVVETLKTVNPSWGIQRVTFHGNSTVHEVFYRAIGSNNSGTVWGEWKKILVQDDLTDSTTIDDSTKVASAKAVKTVNDNLTSLQQTVTSHLAEYETLLSKNAIMHNNIYRGKFLGNSVTPEQYQAISSGTFEDLYIGDYWTINGVTYRIAGFDYYYNTGDIACTTHHAVIVPDSYLYMRPMNDANTTAGGYVNSKMYKEGLSQALSTIKSAFSGHVLKHRQLLCNATSDGKASGWAWFDSEVELMTEPMVYGSVVWGESAIGGSGFNIGVDKSQLPLFALNPRMINTRQAYWLRDVVSDSHFAYASNNGSANAFSASNTIGVRPVFCIS